MSIVAFFERLFFAPKKVDFLVAFLLLPFSVIYGLAGFAKQLFVKPKDYGVKIISIGNLIIGGSGKTPFAIELIEYLNAKFNLKIIYISRGYGRVSKGLVEVKRDGEILVNVEKSGDEAMLVAKESKADVIVSKDRVKAINLAKKRGANLIILDDAFSKVGIKKFDIILEPKEIKNLLPIPSGPFREFYFAKKRANLILKEDIDFKRVVEFKNLTPRMLLVTAISNPKRLDRFLPKGVVGKYCLKDHSFFNKEEILKRVKELNATSILVTQKDLVKLDKLNLAISVIKLKLDINSDKLRKIENYIKE